MNLNSQWTHTFKSLAPSIESGMNSLCRGSHDCYQSLVVIHKCLTTVNTVCKNTCENTGYVLQSVLGVNKKTRTTHAEINTLKVKDEKKSAVNPGFYIYINYKV